MEQDLLLHYYGICERINDDFLAEPLNLLTNSFFFIAAFSVWRYMKRNSDLAGLYVADIYVLIGLITLIGIGSTIFHAYPNATTELMDLIPIVTFIVAYFICAIRRVVRCGWFETAICLIAFAGATHIFVSYFPNAMNDSIGYLSTMGALIMMALYLNVKKRATARMFLVAALIGVISLFFRSIDNAICDVVPLGSHFMWHSCNALLVYIIMVQLVRNINRRARMLRAASEHFA